jgi:hypothetical protein
MICDDYFHNLFGDGYLEYNHLNDTFLIGNIFIFVVALLCNYVSTPLLKRFIVLYLLFYIFRWLLVCLTTCYPRCMNTTRTWLLPDEKWHFISGHTLTSLLVTIFLYQSQAPEYLKMISGILTLILIMTLLSTREHYSADILLTVVLVFLVVSR